MNTQVSHEDYVFVLESVDSVSGDCDVTQRKGKVLCIYDMTLRFSVKVEKDGESTRGQISVPEFVHDQDEDEYVFDIDASEHKAEIRKHFVPELKAKLLKFQDDLIAAHEKDVQHSS